MATRPQTNNNRGGNRGGQQLTAIEQRRLEVAAQVDGFGQMLDALETNLVEVQPRGADVSKLKRIAITAVQKDPTLLTCSRESWITALQLCAQDGLMPDGREAAFVRFGGSGGNTVAYMPMVYGIRKKILQSGEIKDIFTAVVYEAEFENGLFEVALGTDPKITHRPLLGGGDRGEIIAAYSVATFRDGTHSFEVMTKAEIDKVRMVSQTGKKNEGPWREWFGEMARKTVLRRHSKSLPMSSDLRDVEVESMFDAQAFEEAIRPRAEQTGLAGGPARSAQLSKQETAGQLDEIERRAAGATVEVDGPKKDGEHHDQRRDTLTRDNPAAGEGKADDQRGEEATPADHPAWRAAAAIIEEAEKVGTVIDFNSLKSRAKNNLEAMPDDVRAEVEAAFAAAEARLKGAR